MKVKEYLHQADIEPEKLAELLGYKTKYTVTKKLDEEMPAKWVKKLDELSDLDMAPPIAEETENKDGTEDPFTVGELEDWLSNEGRAADKDPVISADSGSEIIGPQKIKLATIQGYIEMIYGGAEMLARTRGDEIAAETISKYTPQYVEAWIDYIKYDERILKYLELFQVGTPLGNLIGIHAISVGAYALARITARELAAMASQNGDGEPEV